MEVFKEWMGMGQFQSTPPREGRPGGAGRWGGRRMFQSTPPREGRRLLHISLP